MLALLPPLKALADETRLRLLNVLQAHELNVNELVAILGMGQSRISRHLKILADSGLAQSRRDGLWVFYSAADAGQGAGFLRALAPLLRDPELARDLERAKAVVDERSKATKRFFDQIAGDWDRRSREVLGGLDLSAELARRMPACRVAADLGCGTGEMLVVMRERAHAVIGVDNSQAMLEQARKRFSGDGQAVSLRIGDLNHLPLRDGEADFALMSLALHHLVRPQDAVAEAQRILGPRGTFLIVEFTRHEQETMRKEHGDRWLGFDPQELSAWLDKSGFKVEDTTFFTVNNGLTVQMQQARKSE